MTWSVLVSDIDDRQTISNCGTVIGCLTEDIKWKSLTWPQKICKHFPLSLGSLYQDPNL